MNRNDRANLARETLKIIDCGSYQTNTGKIVAIDDRIRNTVGQTVLFTPDGLEKLIIGWRAHPRPERSETLIEVTNETTLSAARRLVVEDKHERTLCLNFASAKNPGGGFLGGSQAQEESLARSSALYASLTADMTYYESNRRCGTALYTDHMILSPDVPVFRDDSGRLLDDPYAVAFLTVPAVNAGAVAANEPGNAAQVIPVMTDRAAMLLTVAATRGYRHLVLGAWGCGVFRNRPDDVARIFAEALTGTGPFANVFESVTFAVLDRTANGEFIRPFAAAFENR